MMQISVHQYIPPPPHHIRSSHTRASFVLTPPLLSSNPQVFRAWHRARADAKRKTREEAEAERRKKGMLNGREIFQQEGFVVEDDASATGADEYVREDQAGEEEKIKGVWCFVWR